MTPKERADMIVGAFSGQTFSNSQKAEGWLLEKIEKNITEAEEIASAKSVWLQAAEMVDKLPNGTHKDYIYGELRKMRRLLPLLVVFIVVWKPHILMSNSNCPGDQYGIMSPCHDDLLIHIVTSLPMARQFDSESEAKKFIADCPDKSIQFKIVEFEE